jgi:hypothetical protein
MTRNSSETIIYDIEILHRRKEKKIISMYCNSPGSRRSCDGNHEKERLEYDQAL